MSCISKILEVKGDKPVLICGQIAIEGGGVFKGFEYIITFTQRGHRCGYVAVPESHPLYKSKEEYPDNYEVHGGVTFFSSPRFEEITKFKCTDKWVGFDAAHIYDTPCFKTVDQYFPREVRGIDEYQANIEKQFCDQLERIYMDSNESFSHKTYAFMKNECRLLIN